MLLTILGSSAACMAPGGACSSYLVQHGPTNLVLDCGPGSLANLRATLDYHAVTAIVLSHLHPDHILDLVPYRYGLRYGPGATGGRLPLWTPPGGAAHLERIGQAVGGEAGFFEATFDVREYNPGAGLTISDIHLAFAPTQHYIPCWAIRCEVDGDSLVYTADSGPLPTLSAFARAASLLLAEATLLEREASEEAPGHLTAGEAGELARDAGAQRLALTHLWPELGLQALVASAEAAFGGPVEVARERARFTIGAD